MGNPRVLVAGTADAIQAFARALHGAAEVVPAESVKEALAELDRGAFQVIACNVRFDESRMFEFLQAVMERKLAGVRLIAFRLERRPLSKSSRAAITHALEALGVERFVDFAQVRVPYDQGAALETLRKVVLEESFVPPAPST